jgi:hypothetical protein
VEQELSTLSEHLISSPAFSGIRVDHVIIYSLRERV